MVLEKKKQAKKNYEKKISSSPLDYFDFQNLWIAKMRKNEEECVKKIIIGCAFWNLSVIYFFLFQEGKKVRGWGLLMLKTKIWFSFFGFKNVK